MKKVWIIAKQFQNSAGAYCWCYYTKLATPSQSHNWVFAQYCDMMDVVHYESESAAEEAILALSLKAGGFYEVKKIIIT